MPIAPIAASSAGATAVVAAVTTPGNKKIRVHQLQLWNGVATANNVKFQSGSTDIFAVIPLPLVVGIPVSLAGDNLFETASHFGMRLPELFCGFDRQPGQSPVAYPVACLPQAWAAGSVFMLLQACLGLHVDGIRREVKIVRPHLPADIDQLHVQGLQIGSGRVDLHFQRLEDRIVVVAQSAPGTPKVDVNLQL